MSKEYINSKIECPVCRRDFAKNYLMVHLKKQHSNIYGTDAWDNSRYNKNWENIKIKHKSKWDTCKKPP
tara:strand:+ start:5914 stop:6120 length:207 start_codon:yes stop_codon:yes gene_type:complete